MGFLYSQLFVTPPKPTQDRTGQILIVTGSNTGLGLEAARSLVALNAAKVILACRSTSKAEAAASSIIQSTSRPKSTVEVWPLDLSSYDSVRAFAKRANEELPRLDGVVENAGIAVSKFKEAGVDGKGEGEGGKVGKGESSVVVNDVATFLLAWLLLPKLAETARRENKRTNLSIVSSEVHAWAKFVERKESSIMEALASEEKSNMGDRYNTTKLLEVLYLPELVAHLPSSITDAVTINLINPGLCHSELSRDAPFFLEVLKFFLARKTEVGARTLTCGVEAGVESQGKYMSDCVVADVAGLAAGKEAGELRRRVWSELTDVLEGIEPGVTKVA